MKRVQITAEGCKDKCGRDALLSVQRALALEALQCVHTEENPSALSVAVKASSL